MRTFAMMSVLMLLTVAARAAEPSAAGAPSGSGTEPMSAIEQCMRTWDAGTHITKTKWREICERQIRERASHSGPAQ